MAELLSRFGNRLVFSRRHNCVRGILVFLATNALLIAALVFVLELALIVLALQEISVPSTRDMVRWLTELLH